jgi:hypothetical protein
VSRPHFCRSCTSFMWNVELVLLDDNVDSEEPALIESLLCS